MKHGQLWAGGMLMFWDHFPGLMLLWGCSGAVCGCWGLQRGFAVHGFLPALADLEFFEGEGTQSRTACMSWAGGREAALAIQLPSLDVSGSKPVPY